MPVLFPKALGYLFRVLRIKAKVININFKDLYVLNFFSISIFILAVAIYKQNWPPFSATFSL